MYNQIELYTKNRYAIVERARFPLNSLKNSTPTATFRTGRQGSFH